MGLQYYLCKIGIHNYQKEDSEYLPFHRLIITSYKCKECGKETSNIKNTWY